VIKNGRVRSPHEVWIELQRHKIDQLSNWAKRMKSFGLFVTQDRSVSKHFGEIAAFVQSEYSLANSASFLAGADPWVIAHAQENQGTVVTQEVLVPSTSTKIKIPNICARFAVPCIGAYDAFPRLGMKL
jgi:hypothetical protein